MGTFLGIGFGLCAVWFLWYVVTGKWPPSTHVSEQVSAAPSAPSNVKIVDAGATRLVDLRGLGQQAFIAAATLEAVGRSLARLQAIALTCFVMPPAFASLISELNDVAQAVLWSRVREAAGASQVVCVYVDGAQITGPANDTAKACRVEIAVEWPTVIGQDPQTGAPKTWTGREILAG